MRNAKSFLLLIALVTFSVTANLLIKQAGLQATVSHSFEIFIQPKVLLGFVCFALAGACLILLMRYLPLNLVQAFTAVQYIAIILAAYLVFSEPISAWRWLGITFIMFGIFIVGVTANERHAH